MREFIARYEKKIVGTVSGFDRLVFRGTLRSISYPDGMQHYLHSNDVLLKDFDQHVKEISSNLKKASVSAAKTCGRPVRYLASSTTNKEQAAREIMSSDGIGEGLICAMTCVEPCRTFAIFRNKETKKLELQSRQRQCLFVYHYWIDPTFGFMSARIQTWFPFQIQVCINGREWLGRQMDRCGIRYIAAGNCFPFIECWDEAQRLMERQLATKWPETLNPIAAQLNPIHETIFRRHPIAYYWSTYQSEWAIDVVFAKEADLKRLYPRLVLHGMTALGSSDVMRYLGKRVCLDGRVPNSFSGEVVSTLKEREEGVRIKHVVNGNSVKLYDKAFTAQGSVLRAETTIQNGSDLRVYRPREGQPDGEKSWRPMRRGVADLQRRAELSKKAAERYLDAFAAIDDDTTLEEILTRLGKPAQIKGRRVRALQPFEKDRSLLAAIARAEFTLTGFRNRDLQSLL
ncbi:MAG TPA: hypothetical protein VEQ63_13785, partial [Bryobacteraceae bacterium]|nr:hypothetical protein [Bryobacteraceae bacterium]